MSAPDLADPALYRDGDPESVWAALRAASPVYRNDRRGGEPFWAILSYTDAVQVLRQPELFVSSQGMRLDADPRATRASADRMLIVTDPPRHVQLRRVLNSAFTPRMVARLKDTMRATVRATLDESIERGECDFVQVAAKLPVAVICDMLGVPPADSDFMLDRTMIAFGHGSDAGREAVTQAHTDLLLYYAELVKRRRNEPGDDVVTALVQGEVDGRPLTEEEIFLNCDGLVLGGNETTRHATTGGLLAFMRNPGQWRRMRDAESTIDTTVQEVLRYTSPAMHVARVATGDTELGGQRIRAGDRVAVWLPAANRDPDVFATPEEFDGGRTPNRHLAFAPGEHYCLGSALATTELTVMFEELRDRVRLPELTGKVVRSSSNLVWGFDALPVRLRAR